MLKGQISSLQLFNDSLSQSTLSELFLAGKLVNHFSHVFFNSWALFGFPKSSDD